MSASTSWGGEEGTGTAGWGEGARSGSTFLL